MDSVITKVKQKQIAQLIENDKRLDGRGPLGYREIRVEQGVIEKAEGSARVHLGETEIVAGVKIETGEPFPDTPTEGVLTVNAELVPLASPEYEAGPPDENSIELARIVDRGIRESKMIDMSSLCIEEGKKVFVVFVDFYVLNYDGNLIDASALAAVSALLNAKMANYEIKDGEIKIKSGYSPLPVRRHPVTVTCARIGNKLVADPSVDEEQVMDARISMAIDDDDNICAIQKGSNGYFEPQQLFEAAQIAKKKANEIRKQLKW